MTELSPTSTSFDQAADRPSASSHEASPRSQHRHSHTAHAHASHMHPPPPADGFRPATPSTPGLSEGSSSAPAAHDETLMTEAGPNAVCAGCKRGIEQDGTSGVVISFGCVPRPAVSYLGRRFANASADPDPRRLAATRSSTSTASAARRSVPAAACSSLTETDAPIPKR